MRAVHHLNSVYVLVMVLALTACGGTARTAGQPGVQPLGDDAVAVPFIGNVIGDPNPADVAFMSGMIPHHAQAVLIAGWAATHTTRRDVRVLAERIVVGQRAEIALMQTWLKDRSLPVPASDATHHRMVMNGMEHDMLMPGMLTEADLAQLDKARGPEWDRLFLAAMIRHHEGALTMVDELFRAFGAMQDDDVYKFVSDLYADQTTEIERMQKMLEESPQ
jgi:uncharacterized protein (DUF305 family)